MKKSKLMIFVLVLALVVTSVAFGDALKMGSKGSDVVKLQTQLKKLGYFKGDITGYFGSETQTAVKKFQAKNGIKADGVVGDKTSKTIFGKGTSSTQKTAASTKPLSAAEKTKRAQLALKKLGFYSSKIDGTYGSGTSTAVKKFQKKYGLKVTGILNSTTESLLLKKAAMTNISRGEIDRRAGADQSDENDDQDGDVDTGDGGNVDGGYGELLDWTVVNGLFDRGDVATVIDVYTGKSFKIKRTYGGNHADCETLTKEDTAVMKKIWGGSWSWNRRPVIIVVHGKRIAASAAGMPHAGLDSEAANTSVKGRSGGFGSGTNLDAVKGNGMDGHFDIHFLNSKTHGSNRVDSKHQQAVMKAAGK